MKRYLSTNARESCIYHLQRHMRLQALMSRDGAHCQHCGCRVRVIKSRGGQRPPANAATEDHIIPKCRGGSDTMSNLLLSCRACNNQRGNAPVEVFRAMRKGEKP